MKLAAIYNVFDGEELLAASMECLRGHVDLFIIIWQDVSNFGEAYNPLPTMNIPHGLPHVILEKYTPKIMGVKSDGTQNEIAKRNLGIEMAKQHKCTHFISLDCDEFYTDFGRAKEMFYESRLDGSVCQIYSYFKTPTLRAEKPDDYFVPFIHTLTSKTYSGAIRYPFYVDPTRRINAKRVGKLPVFMHHFSWVRKDIGRKIRNSSARQNIEKSNLVQEYAAAKEGAIIGGQKLITVPDLFNLKSLFDDNALHNHSASASVSRVDVGLSLPA